MNKFKKYLKLFFSFFFVFYVIESFAQEETRMQNVLLKFEQLPKGKIWIELGKGFFRKKNLRDLSKILTWGSKSYTDIEWVRQFKVETGQEVHERKVRVILNKNQSDLEVILDLVHEWVHVISGKGLNPYDLHLTVDQYIYESLEGSGGEVQAFFEECQVAQEMKKIWGIEVSRCERYEDDFLDVKKIQLYLKKDFYRVGSLKEFLIKSLGEKSERFKFLSSKKPRFYSSLGYLPYPVALFKEFQSLNDVVCRSSKKKIDFFKKIEIKKNNYNIKNNLNQLNNLFQKRCL